MHGAQQRDRQRVVRLSGPLIAAFALVLAAVPAAAETRSFGITSYARLVVRGDMIVEVTDNPRLSGRAEGPRDTLLALRVEQAGDTLILSQSRDGPYGPVAPSSGTLTVRISAAGLREVDVRGGGRVRVARIVGDTARVGVDGPASVNIASLTSRVATIVQRGAGELHVAGRTIALNARSTGSGTLDLAQLTSDEATLVAAGSGAHRLQARRTAALTLSGEAGAQVYGSARCTITNSGAGDARCRQTLPSGAVDATASTPAASPAVQPRRAYPGR